MPLLAPPRRDLRRRLLSLARGEAVNIPLQALVWFVFVSLPLTLPNMIGYAVFSLLLIEGAAYWLVKADQLRRRTKRIPGLRWFGLARYANPVVIAIAVVLIVMVPHRGAATWVPGLVFTAVAVVEHLNYFHVQLGDRRRPRRAHLAQDLHRAGGAGRRR